MTTDETTDAGGAPEDPDLFDMGARVVEEVSALRAALASEEEQRKKAVLREHDDRRRKQRLTWAVLGFDVVASVVGLTLWLGQRAADDRIRDSLRQDYVTAQQQDATRVRVLCPLYTLLLASVSNPTPRSPGTPAQQEQFAKAVKTIKDGYATLGCTPKLSSFPTAPSG